MHPTTVSDQLEPTTAEPSLPSGRELLRNGQLGKQLIHMAQLAAQGDEDGQRASVHANRSVEATR